MLNLLAAYSLTDIIIFIVMLAIAFKSVVSFCEWMKGWLQKKFGRKTEIEIQKELHDKVQEEVEEELEEEARNNILQGRLLLGEKKMKEHEEKIDKLTQMVELLIASDRDSIKAYIVEKHHYFCYNKKWIDDFSMDCIEKKYNTYKKEQGNSYVGDLMQDLRALPNVPPKNHK